MSFVISTIIITTFTFLMFEGEKVPKEILSYMSDSTQYYNTV